MKQIIEKIRQKPHHQRDRLVWIIIGVIVGILLILWAMIGIPKREGNSTDIINQFSEDVEGTKDTLPQLFQEN